jgi:23S rRNA (adenine2503-C2)-methyltransferase
MTPLLDISPEELAKRLADRGEQAFRAEQILQWVWRKGATAYAGMSNLPAGLRETFTASLPILTSRVLEQTRSDDGVVKLLIGYDDGEWVECVLIPDGARQTACLSTQAGCAMGCAFCASGLAGWRRDLTGGEILQQALHLQRETGAALTNAVFMGVGEPLANYGATVSAVGGLVDPRRGGLSARKLTVSTVGLPEAIRRLAGEDWPITLAISLHAPTDELRVQLMPTAARYPIAEVLAAARRFYASHHREVTLEYIVLAGVNDTPDCATKLAELARSVRCNVNLIRYNPVPALPFRRPDEQRVRAFADRLSRRGVNVQVRRSRGGQSQSACGQLRLRSTDARINL